jgi:hypothetical protein
MLANMIRALTRFFNRERGDLFKPRRPIEVSLPPQATSAIDNLKARYSIEVTLPGEPFLVFLE